VTRTTSRICKGVVTQTLLEGIRPIGQLVRWRRPLGKGGRISLLHDPNIFKIVEHYI